jgi:hypothetical protein
MAHGREETSEIIKWMIDIINKLFCLFRHRGHVSILKYCEFHVNTMLRLETVLVYILYGT